MQTSTTKTLSILIVTLLASCAHHDDVRPGENGIHEVILKTDSKDEGFRSAMSEAKDFCDEEGKTPVRVSEGSEYTGTMSEDTYNGAKTAAKVATAAGTAALFLGGKKQREVGAPVGMGGIIADSAIGQGYTYRMSFKCAHR